MGVYVGQKMSPFLRYLNGKPCELEIVYIEENGDLEVIYDNERYNLIKKENIYPGDYLYESKKTQSILFSKEKVPSFIIFAYTDGPAYRSASSMWDCTMLKRKR